jgi:hypothetical protein
VLDRIDSGPTAQFLGELRRVTCLFINLKKEEPKDKQDYGKPSVDMNQVHKALTAMQSVLFHYEGVVRQFLVDDKGTVLIGVFGVPPFSHEDDAVRGIHAAIDIHSSLLQIGMENSIGVTYAISGL